MLRKSMVDTDVTIVREVIASQSEIGDMGTILHFEVAHLPGFNPGVQQKASGPFILCVTNEELLVFAVSRTTSVRGSDSRMVARRSDKQLKYFGCSFLAGNEEKQRRGGGEPSPNSCGRGSSKSSPGPLMRWELRRFGKLSLRRTRRNNGDAGSLSASGSGLPPGFWASGALMVGPLEVLGGSGACQELVIQVMEGGDLSPERAASRRHRQPAVARGQHEVGASEVRVLTTERGSNLPSVLAMLSARAQVLEAGCIPASVFSANRNRPNVAGSGASELDAAQRFLKAALQKLRACDSVQPCGGACGRGGGSVDATSLDDLCELLKEVEVEALTDATLKTAFLLFDDFAFLGWLVHLLRGFQHRLDRSPTHRHRLRCFELLLALLRVLASFLLHADTAVGAPHALRVLRPSPLNFAEDVVQLVGFDFAALFDAVQFLAVRQENDEGRRFLLNDDGGGGGGDNGSCGTYLAMSSARSFNSSASSSTSSTSSTAVSSVRSLHGLSKASLRFTGASRIERLLEAATAAAAAAAKESPIPPREATLMGDILDVQACVLLTLHTLAAHSAAPSAAPSASRPLHGDPEAVTAALLATNTAAAAAGGGGGSGGSAFNKNTKDATTAHVATPLHPSLRTPRRRHRSQLNEPLLASATAPSSSSTMTPPRSFSRGHAYGLTAPSPLSFPSPAPPPARQPLPPFSPVSFSSSSASSAAAAAAAVASSPLARTEALVARCCERVNGLLTSLAATYRRDRVDAWLACGCPCLPLATAHRRNTAVAGTGKADAGATPHGNDGDSGDGDDGRIGSSPESSRRSRGGDLTAEVEAGVVSPQHLAGWLWDHSKGVGRVVQVKLTALPTTRPAALPTEPLDKGSDNGSDDGVFCLPDDDGSSAANDDGDDEDDDDEDGDEDDGLVEEAVAVSAGGWESGVCARRRRRRRIRNKKWGSAVVLGVKVVPRRKTVAMMGRTEETSGTAALSPHLPTSPPSPPSSSSSSLPSQQQQQRQHWGLWYRVRFLDHDCKVQGGKGRGREGHKGGKEEGGSVWLVPPEDVRRPFTQTDSPKQSRPPLPSPPLPSSSLKINGNDCDNKKDGNGDDDDTKRRHDGEAEKSNGERNNDESTSLPLVLPPLSTLPSSASPRQLSTNTPLQVGAGIVSTAAAAAAAAAGEGVEKEMEGVEETKEGEDDNAENVQKEEDEEEEDEEEEEEEWTTSIVNGGTKSRTDSAAHTAVGDTAGEADADDDGNENSQRERRRSCSRERRKKWLRWKLAAVNWCTPRDRFHALEMQVPSHPWATAFAGGTATTLSTNTTAKEKSAAKEIETAVAAAALDEEDARRRRRHQSMLTQSAVCLRRRGAEVHWWRDEWDESRTQFAHRAVPSSVRFLEGRQGDRGVEGDRCEGGGGERLGDVTKHDHQRQVEEVKNEENEENEEKEDEKGALLGGVTLGTEHSEEEEEEEVEATDYLCGGEVALYHHAGLLLTLLRAKPALAASAARESSDELREGLCRSHTLDALLLGPPTLAQLRLNRRSVADLRVVAKALARVLVN